MEDKETVEAFIARDGQIKHCSHGTDLEARSQYVRKAKRNRDYSMYDYSDRDYAEPLMY